MGKVIAKVVANLHKRLGTSLKGEPRG